MACRLVEQERSKVLPDPPCPPPRPPRSSSGGKLVEQECSKVSPSYGSLAPAVYGLIGNSSAISQQITVRGVGGSMSGWMIGQPLVAVDEMLHTNTAACCRLQLQ